MNPRDEAASLRSRLALGEQPAYNLPELIEESGMAMVAVWPFRAELSGFMMKDPALDRVIISISACDAPFRQRFTLAHELGHLVADDFQSCSAPGRSPSKERWADEFAGHFLLPGTAVAALMSRLGVPKGDIGRRELSSVVRHFGASPEPARIALARVGYTLDKQEPLPTAPQLATEFGWRGEYEALEQEASVARPPAGLLARMVAAFQRGDLSMAALARARQIPEDQMKQELEEAGIFPMEHASIPFEFPA